MLDTLSPQIHGPVPTNSALFQTLKGKARFLHGSVCDRAALHAALQGQQAVVHLAAETGTGQSMYQVARYTDTNIGGTALLLDILGQEPHAVRRLVVASSRAVYGEGAYIGADGGTCCPPPRIEADLRAGRFEVMQAGLVLTAKPTREDALLHPSSVYGVTKLGQEQLVMTVCPLLGIEAVALRYQNVYGPGQSLGNPYTGVLSNFSNLMMQGSAVNIFEDGRESRDFVFVSDAVDATVLALQHEAAVGQVLNVGSGLPTRILDLAQELAKALQSNAPLAVSGMFRLGDIRHNTADLGKIAALGFAPKVTLATGIARFASWARAIGPVENGFAQSLIESQNRGVLK